MSTVPIQTWRPKKWPKVGLAILLGSRLSIRLDEADAKLIDGANMVHFCFRPDGSIKSFRDYADKKMIPYIERQLVNTKKS